MKIGWRMAKTYSSTYQKMYLYSHVGRSLWDIIWIEETQDGQVADGGIKEGAYLRKDYGYEINQMYEYAPEPEDIRHAVIAVFGEL
jgi:hypothetical protein